MTELYEDIRVSRVRLAYMALTEPLSTVVIIRENTSGIESVSSSHDGPETNSILTRAIRFIKKG